MSRYLSAVQRALPMPIDTAMFACAGTFTWVCPPGVYRVQAIVAGAGGGGGALTTNNYGGGGGGAGGASLAYVDVVPGNSYTVTVGAGGLGMAMNAAIDTFQWDRVSVILLTIFAVVVIVEIFVTYFRRRLL